MTAKKLCEDAGVPDYGLQRHAGDYMPILFFPER